MSAKPQTLSAEALIPVMLAAGDEIMRIYGKDFDVSVKSDASPVTEADEAAEKIILSHLKDLAPDIPVIAEESVAAGVVPEIGNCFFLVDPLDGTKEFISKNGEFTVNIALIDKGVPILGAVYAPAIKRLFWGDVNGAHQATVEDGKLVDSVPLCVRKASDALTAVGSRSHGSAETDAFLERFKVENFKPAGSSLKFCLVAAGEADLYPRFGRTMQWDTAAGDAVLRAAGGMVFMPDLETPLPYGKAAPANGDFSNGYFAAIGDQDLLSR